MSYMITKNVNETHGWNKRITIFVGLQNCWKMNQTRQPLKGRILSISWNFDVIWRSVTTLLWWSPWHNPRLLLMIGHSYCCFSRAGSKSLYEFHSIDNQLNSPVTWPERKSFNTGVPYCPQCQGNGLFPPYLYRFPALFHFSLYPKL